MPKKFTNVIVLANGTQSRIYGEFPAHEWQHLVRFHTRAEALRANPIAQAAPGKLYDILIQVPSGKAKASVELPRTEFNDLAMCLRPFILQKESTEFGKIRGILTRAIQHQELQSWLTGLKKDYEGANTRNAFDVIHGDVKVVSHGFLMDWLHCKVFHEDAEVEARIDKTVEIVDPDVMKQALTLMLMAKVACISFLWDLIGALKKGTPFIIPAPGPLIQGYSEWRPDAGTETKAV